MTRGAKRGFPSFGGTPSAPGFVRLFLMFVVFGWSASRLPAGDSASYEPTSNYEIQWIEGFKVYVHQALLSSGDPVDEAALREIRSQLYLVTRAVPDKALAALREIPIWMESESEVVCACHHPSRRWLVAHGYNPEKAGAVELGNMRNFVNWIRQQPWMVMHELAHGYHQNVVGHGNEEWLAAYRNAMDKKLYDRVLHIDGKMVKAYACTNDKEYFAELSEAYFGTNDMFPFVRAELRRHDPVAFGLLEKFWGKR